MLSGGITPPPLQDTDYEDFENQVLQEAFDRIGVEVSFKVAPNQRSLTDTNNGVTDGQILRIKGMEANYPNLIPIPEKISTLKFVAFSKESIDTTAGWESLKAYKTAYINGWKIFDYNVPESTDVTKVHSPIDLFNLLDRDRTEVILYELWQGLALVKYMGISSIQPAYPPLAERDMFTYLHKKHAHLVPKLAQALRDMKQDGTYQQLYNQFLKPLENLAGQ